MGTNPSEVATLKSQTSKRSLQMLVILGSLTALGPLSIDMYLPALPALSRDLHASTSLIQLSLTACLLGLALGQLVAGPISDARGRKVPLVLGLALYAVVSLLCAFANGIWMLIPLRLLQGLAGSSGIVIARATVRDHYSGIAMTKFFALLMLVNGAAPILAPVIGGQLLRFTSWHGVFVVLCILGLGMFTAVIFGLPESLPRERRATGGLRKTFRTLRRLVVDRTFMGYSLSQGFVFAAMFGYISGSPFVMQQLFGVSPQAFSFIFAANGIGIMVAGQLSARLAAHFGERRVLQSGLVIAMTGAVLLLIVLLLGWPLFVVLPPLFAVVASVGIVSPTCTSLAMQEQGKNAGSAAAVIGLVGQLIGSLASPMVGIAGSSTDTPMGLVIAICDVAALFFYSTMVRLRGAGTL